MLNPFVRGDLLPSGYAVHFLGAQRVVLNPIHGKWLRDLASHHELAWVSTWEAEATIYIGPAIEAPPNLPFIAFPEQTEGGADVPMSPADKLAQARAMLDAALISEADG